MKNNGDFANQMFTWSLDKSNNQGSSSSSNDEMSEAELFQMLLGEEAQQATTTTSGDSSSDDMSYKLPASSVNKLDFRPVHEDFPEAELTSLSTKEKRQLRNKISARNFRNRRKEYISKIEDELTLQKNENVQLKLEIKWLKNKMEKMQKENDKLRLDLMVGGMLQQPTQVLPQQTTATGFLLDSTTLINANFGSSTYSSDESTLSSPPNLLTEFPDNWDFVLPADTTTDTYLSHALVPDWNINQVLSKDTSSHFSVAPTMFQKYPLLAPALMSIVISHTMTMSTDELLATTKLSPSSLLPPYTKPTIKEVQATWDILESLQKVENKEEKVKEEDKNGEETCSLVVFKQTVCRYLCQLVSNYMSYYSVEQEDNNTPHGRFSLCRKFQRVKNHISTSC